MPKKPAAAALCLALLAFLLSAPPCRATTYATWLMVWNSHTERWWNPNDSAGAKVLIGGRWQSIDWADDRQMEEHLRDVRRAGIRVVVADLTNGWGWLDTRCQKIQALCARYGLQFCVAENSTGDVPRFESHAHDIWDHFAGPAAPYHKTYLQYHGKPLIVCYAVRDWYHAYTASTGPWRLRFNLVWASGEDSDRDKWGWQLEPWIGSLPSRDSMFVTSAVKWANDDQLWRKSLAWLDYNFALARRQHPAYIIVGSYDDVFERNAWLPADTSGRIPGRQMRDKTGALSTTAYYERVREWIRGRPPVVGGGYLRDGCYRIRSRKTGDLLRLDNPAARAHAGAAAGDIVVSAPATSPGNDALNGEFWLYHLGQNRYRIITLQSGLALQPSGTHVVQDWESPDPRQRWILERVSRGVYRLRSEATGQALSTGGTDGPVTLADPGHDDDQQWQFEPVLLL